MMGLLRFGLCVVISISCASKIRGDNSRRFFHTELRCLEEDGVIQIGPCMQCVCVKQKIVCVKVACAADDDDYGSIAGTDAIAMYQNVRPPEIIVKLPNSPITNTIYKQPIQDILQEDDFPDQVVAVSIMSNDGQGDELEIPISIQPHTPSVYIKEKNTLNDLLADNSPNDPMFLAETRVEDVLKTLLTSSNDNNNDRYLLVVPEDFQSHEDDSEKNLPTKVTWKDVLNNNFITQPSYNNKEETVPFVLVKKKVNLKPVIAIDEHGRPTIIPLARQPHKFARPGDAQLVMRPRHYMRNDDSSFSKNNKAFKQPWFNRKPVYNIPAKGSDSNYWYDLLQKRPENNLYTQYESEGNEWPFNKEKSKIDYETYKKFQYPWFNNYGQSEIGGPAGFSDRNYMYKLLQQNGADTDLSSYYKKEIPNNNLHTVDQSYVYNKLMPNDRHYYKKYANTDGLYNKFSNQYNRYETPDSDQNQFLDEKEEKIGNFNMSDNQQFIRPIEANYQGFNNNFNSSFPKTFEGMNQIPLSYQLQGQNINEYPGVSDQNKYANNFIPISNNQPNMDNAYENKNQTMTDQLKWQDANGYSEILSNKQPNPGLELNELDLFGTGDNQQIFNFLQQKNDSNYDAKSISNKFSKISQSLQNRPIKPDLTLSGSTVNISNEQMLLPNGFQLQQHDNSYFEGLNNKHPDNYQYNYKSPAHNIIQTFGNKQQVKYFSNDTQYTSNNFSKILYGQQNTPLISISEVSPSGVQYEKPGSTDSITNANQEEIVKQIKWLQDYLPNNKQPELVSQSSSIDSANKLKPGKYDYLSHNSGYSNKKQKLLPDQYLLQYGNKYPSTQNYKDREPTDYDEYGELAFGNQQMFNNKPKVKDFNYNKKKWSLFGQLNSDRLKLSKQHNSISNQDKNSQLCGPNQNCGYKPWPLGKKNKHIPLSLLLGDSNDEQDSPIKYEDSDGNTFITAPFTNYGIPDFENQDSLLFNENDKNFIVLTYPNIDNRTQLLDNEQSSFKEPWDFTYVDENNADRVPDLSFTTLSTALSNDLDNIQQPYNIPEAIKYEFSQQNSVVPKEPVLLPYHSKSKKHRHKHKRPNENVPIALQDVISEKQYNVIPTKYRPYLNKLQYNENNIPLTGNLPYYEVYPNQLSNYVSVLPPKYKSVKQHFVPGLQNPNSNTITSLPNANQILYNKEPVPFSQNTNNMNPLHLITEPNYYPLHNKGSLPKNKVHIILPNNMPILPNLFSKRVISAQIPKFYSQYGLPKFPANNLFSKLYGSYYPQLSSFPQVSRNNVNPTSVSDILKFLKKIANNIPLKLFLKDFLNLNEYQMLENIDDYEADKANLLFNQKQDVSDYHNNLVYTVPKVLFNNDNIQIGTNHFPGPIALLKGENANYIELPSYDYKEKYPVYSDTSSIEDLERYVNNFSPDLIAPWQAKPYNILGSDDRILPKYKKKNNVDCVICESFNNKINLLAKYLYKNHQQYNPDQTDIIYLILKDIIKPLVQFIHKLIFDKNNSPSKITSAKPNPLISLSKHDKMSMSPKFRPFNNKKKKNRYFSNNPKNLSDLNGKILYQNDSQKTLNKKHPEKPELNQHQSSPSETTNDYSKPGKSKYSNLNNKHNKKRPKTKKQRPRGIAREDKSDNSVSDSQSVQRESQTVEDNENKVPKKLNNKIQKNEDRVSFEDYLDIPIEEEEDSDEYSSYHRPKLHKLSSIASDPNRKIYLYQNPNAKFTNGPYLPEAGVNIKLYDKPHDSDEDPVLTDEFNLIPMGMPTHKHNSDKEYGIQNDGYNTKSRESYDRIRIALHNPGGYDNIKPFYNPKISDDHKKIPITDHHIAVPTLYPEQICPLCKILNCNRDIPNNSENNLQSQFSNHIPNHNQFDISKITAYAPNTDVSSDAPLLDSYILSRLVRALVLDIIAESKLYTDNIFKETHLTNVQESSKLSDIYSLLEYYQIVNEINRSHTTSNSFQNTLPIISSCDVMDTLPQSEYIPYQNDEESFLDSIILDPHIMSSNPINAVMEILETRINQDNFQSNHHKDLSAEVIANLILGKLKPCSGNYNFEGNQNSEIYPNFIGTDVFPLRTMLSNYLSPNQGLRATIPKKNKIYQSEQKSQKNIWSKPQILIDQINNLKQYFNRFKPLLLRKISPKSLFKGPITNHIIKYINNKMHNFIPKQLEKSNIYEQYVKPKRNKKNQFNNIYKTIKHVWEAYLSSDENHLDYLKLLKPKGNDVFDIKPTNHKDEIDGLLKTGKRPFRHESIYSGLKPKRGKKKHGPFINKDYTKPFFNYFNNFKGGTYSKGVMNKKLWPKYNNMPKRQHKLSFSKIWGKNTHNVNKKTSNFLNGRPTYYSDKIKYVEPIKKWRKPKKDQLSLPKYNFKPRNKETKYDKTKEFYGGGRPFKGHKYPAIESLKHAWKISNILSDDEPSTLPKYLKPRDIKEEHYNIPSNNYGLRPSLSDELLYPWQKLSSENKELSFPNELKETQYADLESMNNKIKPEIGFSKIRPFYHNNRDLTNYQWQKNNELSGLGQHIHHHHHSSNKYKKLPEEFSVNHPFEIYEYINQAEPADQGSKNLNILPDPSQLSQMENVSPKIKEIRYPKIKQLSGELNNKDSLEHHEHYTQPEKQVSAKPDGSFDLSSKNSKTTGKDTKYTTLPPIKFSDLLDEISSYASSKSPEQMNAKSSNFESALNDKKTADILFNPKHVLNEDSDYKNYFKGRKIADVETENNSWGNPEISSNEDSLFQSKYLNSDSVSWTNGESLENLWEKFDVDNEDLKLSEPKKTEINLSSTLHPSSEKKENPDDSNSDISAILDYINKKGGTTKTDPKDNDESILEINSKGRNARWVDVTDFSIKRADPIAVRYEYSEAPIENDDNDLT